MSAGKGFALGTITVGIIVVLIEPAKTFLWSFGLCWILVGIIGLFSK